MKRRVVWDISELKGRVARIVAVDTTGEAGLFHAAGHVNVDDFVCDDQPPSKDVEWMGPTVGSTFTPVPVWGTTDTHTHPLANIAFGGTVTTRDCVVCG